MGKIVVGMSGGVDSAVAALLLKQKGHEVIGVTLRTWEADDGSESRCCDIDDAKAVCDMLGIRYYSVNCLYEFKTHVVEPFKADYLRGKTPNPCIECNRYVKWDKLLYYAGITGADHIATGHYASVIRLPNGRYTLKTAAHSDKDQTYMLYRLSQEQLAATVMPLGDLSKSEVRQLAVDASLPVASKPDSQEVCFVTDGSYADLIEKTAGPEYRKEGPFIDYDGNVLGNHKGVIRYTIGQRKGLGIALGTPAYVSEIRPESNEVVLGDEGSLFHKEILIRDANFMGIPSISRGETVRCTVKIRYQHKGQHASVSALDEGTIRVAFDEAVRAPAPGQSAVFYDDNGYVIGGGVISGVLR